MKKIADSIEKDVCLAGGSDSSSSCGTMRFPEAVVGDLPSAYCDLSALIVCCEGPLKLNIGGCARGNPGTGGFGGVVRNSSGFWIFGYASKLEDVKSDVAELWGVYRGLTIVLERNMRKLLIEIASITVINWLRYGGGESWMHNRMIEDYRYLLKSLDCSIQYTPRNANQCAKWLANFGAEQHSPLVVLQD